MNTYNDQSGYSVICVVVMSVTWMSVKDRQSKCLSEIFTKDPLSTGDMYDITEMP
jgi:hypothetical protein